MQVGPPEPFTPISRGGIRVDLAAGRCSARGGPRIALGHDDDAGPDGQDVAAERRELLLRDLDEPDAEVAQQLLRPTGSSGR